MHLPEGLLSLPVVVATSVVAAAAVGLGLRALAPDRMPVAALAGAAFFVASAVRVPVGLGSAHLLLNGLAGVLLGWAALPVLLVGLLLQVLLLGFGGFAVLGANLLIMGVPAVLAWFATRHLLAQRPMLAGALAGTIGVGGAVALAALLLWLGAGRELAPLVALLAAAHVPVLVAEAFVTGFVVAALQRRGLVGAAA